MTSLPLSPRIRRGHAGCALLVIFLGCWTTVQAEDWPRFLGPRADGTSTETGLLKSWPAQGPSSVWTKTIGTGYSAPSVAEGKLVLHHRLGPQEVVEAFDARTGRPLWRHAYPSQFEDPYGYNNGPRCTPLLSSNRCYTFGAEGKLACLDLTTGKLIWQRDTSKDWNVPPAFFGVGSTPLLESGRLIVMVGGQPESGIVAFDPSNGRTLWERVGQSTWNGVTTIGWPVERPYVWRGNEKIASYASPVAATFHGQRHLLCLVRQGLVSLNPTNGQVHFTRWFQSYQNDSVNAMNPVADEDLIFFSAAYYRVGSVLLRVQPDGRTFQEVWRSPKQLREVDPATGRYALPNLEIHWSTPILHQGHLYAFSGRNEPDARFRCVELRTGRVLWDRDESWVPHSTKTPGVFGRGAAILADGHLIALGEGGLLGLFRPDPKALHEISRFQVPQMHYPCWAAPILSDKLLLLRSEDHLVCLNLAEKP